MSDELEREMEYRERQQARMVPRVDAAALDTATEIIKALTARCSEMTMALHIINTAACYASEEDTESRYEALQLIGETARGVLAKAQSGANVAPRERCDHDWPDNDGRGPLDSDRCPKCGKSFLAYVHMECP